MSTDLVPRKRWPVVVGFVTSIAAALTFGGVAIVGGGGIVLGGGGQNRDAGCVETVAQPTISVGALTDSSVVLIGSAFSATCGDTQDSVIWQIDTAGADFSTPVWADTSGNSALFTRHDSGGITSAASVLDSAGVYKARVQYGAVTAGQSSWSDTTSNFQLVASTVVMSWDWADSTGTDNYAVFDSGGATPAVNFQFDASSAGDPSVIADTFGFPTANLLEVDASFGWLIYSNASFVDSLGNGQVRALRWFHRVWSSNTGASTHGLYFGDTSGWGTRNWSDIMCTNNSSGVENCRSSTSDYGVGFEPGTEHDTGNGYPAGAYNNQPCGYWSDAGVQLEFDTNYMVEARFEMTGDTTFALGYRVTDLSADPDTIIMNIEDGDWCMNFGDGAGSQTISNWMISTGERFFDTLIFGINGWEGATGGQAMWYGGVAICDGDWCPAYQAGEGPS